MFDIVLLTDHRYVDPIPDNDYIRNVLLEDRLIKEALEHRGLKVTRINWDNPDFDWSSTKYVLFRSTWDYFERIDEFKKWLDHTATQTKMINSFEQIKWNLDKHYLQDLKQNGINVTETIFLEQGESRSLTEIVKSTDFKEVILKPAIAGAARHTYRFNASDAKEYQSIFQKLIMKESMLLQPFQKNVLTKGEVAYMVFGGKFSHAILKKAKEGDFRVQDDHGGTVHEYQPSKEEIIFAERTVAACNPQPVYARVDVLCDNDNQLSVSELELLEPELWMRFCPEAVEKFANAILTFIRK